MKAAVVILVVGFALSSTAFAWKKPDFCGRSECPPFLLEDDRDSYEIRTYNKSHWVQVCIRDKKYELAYTKAAAKLMKYFKGENKDELKMDITTPTLAALKLEKDAKGTEREYVFSMWVDPEALSPKENRGKDEEPPKPNDKDLEIKKYEDTTVYVRTFGGFATENSILQETNALHEELITDEEEFDQDMVFCAVYDPAIKLLNRHNEIHILKEKEPEPEVSKEMEEAVDVE